MRRTSACCAAAYQLENYRWGACQENEAEAGVPMKNWSCPVCGGVVVEYARVPGGEPFLMHRASR